jgi:hypothetical protein
VAVLVLPAIGHLADFQRRVSQTVAGNAMITLITESLKSIKFLTNKMGGAKRRVEAPSL